MTDTIAGLRAARALVEKGWIQKHRGRLPNGQMTNDVHEMALADAWCADGACWAIEVSPWTNPFVDALEGTLSAEGEPPDVTVFNDAPDRTQQDVLALFSRTIARLEAEAASE